MSISMKDLDPAFQGAGQKAGLEIWRIENFKPARVPTESYGKFYMGDSYIVLKTTGLKAGPYVMTYIIGSDEAGAAAIKTVELDAALGGRAVQYHEVQGHETDKFLSYFKPCIIPLEGGVASGFKHHDEEEYKPRLYVCRGKRVVHVNEVAFARSSLNHEDVFILDTENKIFQFNGSNSCIQERAKALEVVQYIKDTYHHGKCDIASIEDGKLMADAGAGEFWGFFGGFAPLPRKTATEIVKHDAEPAPAKLFCLEKGQLKPEEVESLTREVLNTQKCYILDCGIEVFVWTGRGTSVDDRKSASEKAEELIRDGDRPTSHVIRVMEGFETVFFRAKFDSWPQNNEVRLSEEGGRGKVAALLKRQGVDVKGLVKSAPEKDDKPEPYIDCTGDLQVWRVNGNQKTLLDSTEQAKFYSGDCYIFQYSYSGDVKEEHLIGTWFGKRSVEEERESAITMATKMVESMKSTPTLARFYEGSEQIQFCAIFQSFIVFKGGVSEGYKKHIAKKEVPDDTYSEDSLALFRVQGTGPENMQAIQVDPVPSSLNSSYCYILHNGNTIFMWFGNLTSSDDHELAERQLDIIKPNLQCKTLKEGAELEQFWELLGPKTEYSSQKITKTNEKDPHLFSCDIIKGEFKYAEIYSFTQDDLMTEDVFILDCHSNIFVWVGQQVDANTKKQALTIADKFVERDFLLEKLSPEVPVFIMTEGNEPPFFTRFFKWDSAKTSLHGNSFQRKLTLLKNGGATAAVARPKRRTTASFGSRSGAPDKPQRSRSVSFSPDRARVRGRSPAFTALAANFENPGSRNLSTPPPMIRKLYLKSGSQETVNVAPKSEAIAALTASFEKTPIIPRSIKGVGSPSEGPTPEEILMSSIKEDAEAETEEDDGLPTYPYDRLTTTSSDPAPDIDLTKRELTCPRQSSRKNSGWQRVLSISYPSGNKTS